MKKFILISLTLFACFSFVPSHESDGFGIKPKTKKKKTGTTITTITPYNPENYTCHCTAQDVTCDNAGVCCFFIVCEYGNMLWVFDNCINFQNPNFVANPPTTTPSYYEMSTSVSLIDSETYSEDAMNYYYDYKQNGTIIIGSDNTTTDSEGNVTLVKAGSYIMSGGNLQCLVKRENL